MEYLRYVECVPNLRGEGHSNVLWFGSILRNLFLFHPLIFHMTSLLLISILVCFNIFTLSTNHAIILTYVFHFPNMLRIQCSILWHSCISQWQVSYTYTSSLSKHIDQRSFSSDKVSIGFKNGVRSAECAHPNFIRIFISSHLLPDMSIIFSKYK